MPAPLKELSRKVFVGCSVSTDQGASPNSVLTEHPTIGVAVRAWLALDEPGNRAPELLNVSS